jgi:hypothetical protein
LTLSAGMIAFGATRSDSVMDMAADRNRKAPICEGW